MLSRSLLTSECPMLAARRQCVEIAQQTITGRRISNCNDPIGTHQPKWVAGKYMNMGYKTD